MGSIANYNLGSVQGEVNIKYDGKGVREAKEDVKGLGDETTRTSQKTTQSETSFKSFRKQLSDFGNDVRNSRDAVKGLGDILSAPAKPLLIMSAAHELGVLAAGIAPAVGALALLPAVATSIGIGFAAVKVGTSGMGDAFSAVADGDAKKLAEAMKKLSPEAQNVVKAYQALKPALDGIKMQTQNALMAGFGAELQRVGGAYLPLVTTALVGSASAFNVMGRNATAAITEAKTMNDVTNIVDNTNASFAAMPDFLASILQGFLGIAGVGSEFLPALASGANEAALAFERWVDAGVESGSIHDMISKGLSVIGDLFKILYNVILTVVNVFKPLSAEGESFLGTLVRLTGAMAQWTASAEGQQTIAAIWQLLGAVSGALVSVLTTLAPIIAAIAQWFASLPAPVQSAVAQFVAWGTVIGLLLSKFAPLIGFLTQLPGIIGGVVKAATLLVNGIRIVMTVFRALTVLMMTNPWVALIAAIIALVILIVTNWDTIKTYLAAAWEWIKTTAETVWNAIVSFFTGLWSGIVSVWQTVWGAVSSFFSNLWTGIQTVAMTVWNAIVSFFTTIWTAISTAATTYWNILTTIWSTVWNAIVTVAQTVWNVIFEILRFAAAILLAIFFTIVNPIIELWTACWNAVIAVAQVIWNAIVAFLTMIWTGIVTAATTIWNILVTAWNAVWTAVSTVATTVWNAIVGFLTGVWNTISSVASTVWNAITSAISAAVTAVSSVIQSIWSSVSGFLSGIWNTISGAASSVWNAISGVISSVTNAIWGVIQSVWNTIAGFFSSIWSQISSAVSGGINNVMNLLNNLWNTIRGLAGTAINLLVDAGRNIVTGLWNGIQAMGSWLYNAIMGWVRSVVPGPILQFLGIASPSKYMRDEIGKMIPQGIMVGMSAEENGLIRQAEQLAQAAANAATGAPAVQTMVRAASGTSGITTSDTAVMNAAAAPQARTKTVTVGGLTIEIAGNLDPTNPVLWRDAIGQIRDSISDFERDYA